MPLLISSDSFKVFVWLVFTLTTTIIEISDIHYVEKYHKKHKTYLSLPWLTHINAFCQCPYLPACLHTWFASLSERINCSYIIN